MNQKLLKLGGIKHLGEERWRGALNLFSDVYCTCIYKEPLWEIPSDRVHVIELKKTFLNRLFIGILARTKCHRSMYLINFSIIIILRFLNKDWIRTIKAIKADRVLCSYGDYDWSALNLILCHKVINMPIVRSYKESRIEYDFLEFYAFKYSDKISFYSKEAKEFIENKYGEKLLDGKKILIGYDENALPSCILDHIQYQKKLSQIDGKTHMVILSYRVDSAPNRDRDLDRYYYVELIEKMIHAGLVVHLHCAKYNDDNGINKYQELQEKYPKQFFMEDALVMDHEASTEDWIHSCEILSRYDVGLLHNIVEESKVSKFDKINIPHRFYAYEAAHVVPVIRLGENVVLEKLFSEKKCGYIFHDYTDITGIHKLEFQFYTPSYEEYLRKVLDL